jgi:hypothetical protein
VSYNPNLEIIDRVGYVVNCSHCNLKTIKIWSGFRGPEDWNFNPNLADVYIKQTGAQYPFPATEGVPLSINVHLPTGSTFFFTSDTITFNYIYDNN